MSEAQEQPEEVAYESDVKEDAGAVAEQETDNSEAAELANKIVSESRESSQEYNWRKARQQLEELQYENRMLKRQFEDFQKPKGSPEEDQIKAIEAEMRDLPKDDLLTLEQAEKLALLRERKAELKLKALEERLAQRESTTLEMQVKHDFPDFERIATNENIEELKRDPMFVKLLKGLTDPYDQVAFIHKELKSRGFGSDNSREKKQLERNMGRPKSANSLGGTSPLHLANDFSEWPSPDLKKRMQEEMRQAISGA